MGCLSDLVRAAALVAGMVGCTRDYSFLEHKDAAADLVQNYEAGADRADLGKGDAQRDVVSLDAQVDVLARDMGRDAPEGRDVNRADVFQADMSADGYIIADAYVDSFQRYDAARSDAPADIYSPDIEVYDAAGRADRPGIIFPDAEIPDLYADRGADGPPDLGPDGARDGEVGAAADLGADANANPCPGEAPLNTLQAGVCAGSRNSCGADGWENDYSGVAGYEVNEVSCDDLDNDCDGLIDILEMIDDFNRPDQDGLGTNTLGNPWIAYVSGWTILGNAAAVTWTGGPRPNPLITSDIGHRNTYNIELKFRLSQVTEVGGGGALRFSVNSTEGTLGGFYFQIARGSSSSHALNRNGVELATGTRTLSANTWYLSKFIFNGSMVGLKLWEDGTAEPAGYLMSAATTDVDASRNYITLSGDLDSGQDITTTIDYVAEGCE